MVPSDPPNELRVDLTVLDEILQVMYWLRGEGLAEDVAASDLTRWLGRGEREIEPLLERLARARLVQRVAKVPGAAPCYALTAVGVGEGGRRFADEFAELTRRERGLTGLGQWPSLATAADRPRTTSAHSLPPLDPRRLGTPGAVSLRVFLLTRVEQFAPKP